MDSQKCLPYYATMDDKLAADEARRSVQHEAVKSQVEGEVQAEIADRASQAPPVDP